MVAFELGSRSFEALLLAVELDLLFEFGELLLGRLRTLEGCRGVRLRARLRVVSTAARVRARPGIRYRRRRWS